MSNQRNKKDFSRIEGALLHGVDIHSRRIYFGDMDAPEGGSDVMFSSIATAIRGIDMMLDITNKEPIEIHFSSFGGDAYEMLALVDKIQECPCKIIFYGRGAIMSAGTWIMAVCDERYLSENSVVMVHDGSEWFSGNHTDMHIYAQHSKHLQDTLNSIFENNTRMPREFWDKMLRRDLYLTAEEAIALGLADAIVAYKGRASFRKGVRYKNFKAPVNAQKMKKLVAKLCERAKIETVDTVTIHVPKDQEENIPVYDNRLDEKETDDNEKIS